MNARTRYRFYDALLMALTMLLTACGPKEIVDWPELRGRVYDKETGKPLEGAFVVANWEAHWAGTMGGGSSGCIHAEVARTGAQGGYVIPAWANHAETNSANEQAIHLTVYMPAYKRAGNIFNLDEARVIDLAMEKDGAPSAKRLESLWTLLPSCVPQDEKERQYMERQMGSVYKAKLIEACRLGPTGENAEKVQWLLEDYLDDEYGEDYARKHAKEGCLYGLD